MARTSYVVALGSNRPSRHGSPVATLRAAARKIGAERLSPIRLTPALGPAGRSFANAAAVVSSALAPPEMLVALKRVEREFGRRRGRSWGPRVLDLDIALWSEGCWEGPGLIVPHPDLRRRRFVLDPLVDLVPTWRDPVTGATIRQLRARLASRRPVDRSPRRS